MDLIYRYDPFQPIALKSPVDAAAALAELETGNRRTREIARRLHERTMGAPSGEPMVIPVSPISLGLPVAGGHAPMQSPFALMVGCSDARAPIEAIFDQAFNSLFVVRVAGNVLGNESLGSVNFAVQNLHSLRVAVALGHSECGAVTAAVDGYLSPKDYVDIANTHALRFLIDRIQLAVRGAAKALRQVHGSGVGDRPGYRSALRDVAVYLNTALTAFDLQRELAISGVARIETVFAVYDLASLEVKCNPGVSGEGGKMFAPAPASADAFVMLAQRWAESPTIVATLNG